MKTMTDDEILAESLYLCASTNCPFRYTVCSYPKLRAELGRDKESCVKIGACYAQISRADYYKYYRDPKS